MSQTRALPIASAFVGVMLCFAGWVVLMIRSQQHAPSAGRATWNASDGVVRKQRARSSPGARVSAWLLLLRSTDAGRPEPYLLPMPYAVALRDPGDPDSSWNDPDPTRAVRAASLPRAA